MSRLLKILKNRYVILVILVLSSYLYASVYQNIAMTPIDKIGTELQEVAKDPEFIREYEEVSSFTEEDLKQGLQKMGALKSTVASSLPKGNFAYRISVPTPVIFVPKG